MRLSHYFEDLKKAYRAEIEDLQTDSEGKNVLAARLKEKRTQFAVLMPMIEFAPEMVAPAFHGGVTFTNPQAMLLLSTVEPEEFPAWAELTHAVHFDAWAEKLVAIALLERGGERFMITTICLEFLLGKNSGKYARHDSSADVSEADEGESNDDDEGGRERGDDDEQDLEEAGADWLAEQGFDRRD